MTGESVDRRDRERDPDRTRNRDPDPTPPADPGSGTGAVSPDAVRERLREVVDPCSEAAGTDLEIVEMGLVESVAVDGGSVTVSMRLTSPGCMMVEYFAREVDDRVGSMAGVESVTLETDAGFDWHRGLMEETAREVRAARRRGLRERYGDDTPEDGATAAAAGDPGEAGGGSGPGD